MKPLNFAIVLMALISCQKDLQNVNKPEPLALVIEPPKITYTLFSNIVSSATVSGIETVTYTNGSKAVIKADKLNLSKFNITVSKNGKSDLISATKITVNGLTTIQFFTGNNMYLSFQINSQNYIGNIIFNELYYPFTTIDPSGKLTYVACMKKMFKNCFNGWACSIVCGFGLVGCTNGWSLSCVGMAIGG